MSFAAAHRGLSADHPENTLHAFEQAIDAGFPCLEMDLRLTHDKQVVVLHDAGIDRTTDGNGRVADFTYEELCDYDTGEGPIPRLDEVMQQLAGRDVLWNLEVKDKHAVEPTLRLVEAHGLEDQALVSAMDPRTLRKAQKEHPNVQRGLIVLGPPDDEDLRQAAKAGCSWLNLDHSFADDDTLHTCRAAGFRLGVWTVNDSERAQHLAAWGVDCVITDTRAVLAVLPTPGPVHW
ncbi:MAG: glycerophosphodiester phosphodiesterase [Thermoplasmatota archaeon]